MLLCFRSPLVYTNLVGELKAGELTALSMRQMQAYADAEICVLTVLAFLNDAQCGIHHRTMAAQLMRKPIHGGVLVGLRPTRHEGVKQFKLDAYFQPLTDSLVRSIAEHEARASLDWKAVIPGMERRWPGQVAWAPCLHYIWQAGVVRDVALEGMAMYMHDQSGPPRGTPRFLTSTLLEITVCTQAGHLK